MPMEKDNTQISYITNEVKHALRKLPPFENVTDWQKDLRGVLMDFTFMNLLIYLVYGRGKSSEMYSLKAFKFLKAYKFYCDGFVKNIWVYECLPTGGTLNLRELYFQSYVHHSLTCNSPLNIFVSLNGNSEIYTPQNA